MPTQTKEHPILFSAPMIRAILGNRKNQTRRVIKPQPISIAEYHIGGIVVEQSLIWPQGDQTQKLGDRQPPFGPNIFRPALARMHSPYRDRLWVKETHFIFGWWVKNGLSKNGKQKWKFRTDPLKQVAFEPPHHTPARWEKGWHKRPSIFMPRWASRITLEIVSVRVERLRQMSNEDAQAEGIQVSMDEHSVNLFADLWDSINGKKHPWESNPFVWVIEFRKV